MAMELEFYVPDSPNGEVLDFAVRCSADTLLPLVERHRRPEHCYIVLRHMSRHRGEWIIWVRAGYASGTHPTVGRLMDAHNLPPE